MPARGLVAGEPAGRKTGHCAHHHFEREDGRARKRVDDNLMAVLQQLLGCVQRVALDL